MPGAAKLFDKLTDAAGSSFVGPPDLGSLSGRTRHLRDVHPQHRRLLPPRVRSTARPARCPMATFAATTSSFAMPSADYPDGWLCIDFQLMFRGPVPSDLAYLLSSGSVLPEVYTGEKLETVLRAFYDRFMAKTQIYKDYSYEQFEPNTRMMTMVPFVYYVGMGAAWQGAALSNELPGRIELGGKGATEADLAPEELRQRMWWRKALANFRENFKAFDQYRSSRACPITWMAWVPGSSCPTICDEMRPDGIST